MVFTHQSLEIQIVLVLKNTLNSLNVGNIKSLSDYCKPLSRACTVPSQVLGSLTKRRRVSTKHKNKICDVYFIFRKKKILFHLMFLV